MKTTGLIILLLTAVSIPKSLAINFVTDGSFEGLAGTYGNGASIGAWNVVVGSSNVGVYTPPAFSSGANATDGNQAFDLGVGGRADGNSISQTLATVAGQTYRLSFDWGSEYAKGLPGANITVGNLSETISELTRDPGTAYPNQLPWIIHSFSQTFVASGSDLLTFGQPSSPADPWGLALDNIKVESVPDTGSTALLALFAVSGLVALRRSINRK